MKKKLILLLFIAISAFSISSMEIKDEYSVFAGVGLPSVIGVQGKMTFEDFIEGWSPAITLDIYGGTLFGIPYATGSAGSKSNSIDIQWASIYADPKGQLDVGLDSLFGISSKTFWYTLDLGDISIPLGTSLVIEGGSSSSKSADSYSYMGIGIGLAAEAYFKDLPIIPFVNLSFLSGSATVKNSSVTSEKGKEWVASQFQENGVEGIGGFYTGEIKWEYLPVSFTIGARYPIDLSFLSKPAPEKEEKKVVPPGFNNYSAIYVGGPFPTELGMTLAQDRTAVDLYLQADYNQFFSTSIIPEVQAVWKEFKDTHAPFALALGASARYCLFDIGETNSEELHIPIWIGASLDFGWGMTSNELGGMFVDAKVSVGADFDIPQIKWLVPYVNFAYGFGLGFAGIGELNIDSSGVKTADYPWLTAFTPFSLQIGVRVPLPKPKPKAPKVIERGVYKLPDWLLGSNWHRNPTMMTSQAWSFDRKGRSIKYSTNYKEDPLAKQKFDESSVIEVITATETEYSVKVRDINGEEKVFTFVYQEELELASEGELSISMEGPYCVVNGDIETPFGKLGGSSFK